MDDNLRVYKGLVDLLESHADEIRMPLPNNWKKPEAIFITEILNESRLKRRQRSSRKYELQVFCSVIHLSSAIIFQLAQYDLRAQLELEINFYQTSSLALKGFMQATNEKRPALITVTDGTASVLAQSSQHSWPYMTVPPVALKLASTERIKTFETGTLSKLQYVVTDHPTDLNFFRDFKLKHLANKGAAELLLITQAPESIEILSKAKKDQVLLVNPHMAQWARASVKGLKPLRLLRGWHAIENRYIFGNSFFRDLIVSNNLMWFYSYLKDKFENLRQQKRDFVTNAHIGKEAFVKVVRTDYFNF